MPGASPGGASQPTTYIEAMAAEAKAEAQAEREKAGLEGGWGAELATAKAEFEAGRKRSGGQGSPLNPLGVCLRPHAPPYSIHGVF